MSWVCLRWHDEDVRRDTCLAAVSPPCFDCTHHEEWWRSSDRRKQEHWSEVEIRAIFRQELRCLVSGLRTALEDKEAEKA